MRKYTQHTLEILHPFECPFESIQFLCVDFEVESLLKQSHLTYRFLHIFSHPSHYSLDFFMCFFTFYQKYFFIDLFYLFFFFFLHLFCVLCWIYFDTKKNILI